MSHIEFTRTAPDGQQLYFQGWAPDLEPKAVVCLVHGLGEHVGRYEYVGQTLNEAGYAVLGFDQRGHGKTPGRRGVTPPFEWLMGDIELLLDEAAKRHPDKPRFLYGHSMGGNFVLNYAIEHKPAVAGVIATSPGLRTAFKPSTAKVAAGKLLYRVAPNLVMPNGLDVNAICQDADVVSNYCSDPLVHNKMSARLGLDILQRGEWAIAHAAECSHIPLLLVHGTGDTITSVAATEEFASRVKGNCTLKLWPGYYHETHNEPEKGQVLRYMIEWLDQLAY